MSLRNSSQVCSSGNVSLLFLKRFLLPCIPQNAAAKVKDRLHVNIEGRIGVRWSLPTVRLTLPKAFGDN